LSFGSGSPETVVVIAIVVSFLQPVPADFLQIDIGLELGILESYCLVEAYMVRVDETVWDEAVKWKVKRYVLWCS